MRFSVTILSIFTSTLYLETIEAFNIHHKSNSFIKPLHASKDPTLDFPSYDFPYEAAKLDRPSLPTAPNAKRAQKPGKIPDAPPAVVDTIESKPIETAKEDLLSKLDVIRKDIISKSSNVNLDIDTKETLQKLDSIKNDLLSKSQVNVNIDTKDLLQKIETLKKDINSKVPNTFNLSTLDISSIAPLVAVPVVGLVSLRISKAQREKREAEKKAKEEAERLAKAEKRVFYKEKLNALVESATKSSSVIVDKAKVVTNNVKDDVVKRLKESNVDDDTLVKAVGAIGAGIVTVGLISGAGKPKEITVPKDEPAKAVKKAYSKPKTTIVTKEEIAPKEVKSETIKYEENVKDIQLTSKPETSMDIKEPKTEPIKPKVKEDIPLPKTPANIIIGKTNTPALPSPLALASFAGIIALRANLINNKERREEKERMERMEKFNETMDDAINSAKNANALLQMKLYGMAGNDSSSSEDTKA